MLTKEQINQLKIHKMRPEEIPGLLGIFETDKEFFASIMQIIAEPDFMENYISLLKISGTISYQCRIQDPDWQYPSNYLFKPTRLMICFGRFLQESYIFYSRAIPLEKWKHLGEEQFEILKRLLKELKLDYYEEQLYYKKWKEKVYALASELRKSGELLDP